MISYLGPILGGLALAAAALLHPLLLRSPLGVSGKLRTLLTPQSRLATPAPEFSPEELMRLMTQVSAEEFGKEPAAISAPIPQNTPAQVVLSRPATRGETVIFFVALALGGTLAGLWDGRFGGHPLSSAIHLNSALQLALGGVCVGAGARLAGGCTSGHGLFGVSRFQPGSIVSVLCFFAGGILTAFVLGAFG